MNSASLAAFGNNPLCAKYHQVLRHARVSDANCLLEGVDVMFATSQLDNNANAVRMGENP